jgi:signal transduction histidine kinase
VLGICGMLAFFGLSFARGGPWEGGRDGPSASQRALAESLADYYVAHDMSWAGVEQRASDMLSNDLAAWMSFALLDADGRVLVSNSSSLRRGEQVERGALRQGVPVLARGEQVGALLLPDHDWPAFGGVLGEGHSRAPSFIWPVLRGFVLAGLGLISLLLLLAVLLARRLSRPIGRLTAAAQALAAGRLDVQVEGAPVRELHELTLSFNRMARALAQADQQRRQMTADIAHELRTPLTIIKGRLEGLQDGVYSASPEQIAQLIDEAALLERLVEDLRLLALAEAGRLELYREQIEPRDLLDGAAASFAVQAERQGVALRVEAEEELPALEVDPQRMAQVLANLVSNALRYTPQGGTITLVARRHQIAGATPAPPLALKAGGLLPAPAAQAGNKTHPLAPRPSSLAPRPVLLQVVDSGAGIAPEDLPHIFDRFWRADRSRTRGGAASGGGLGLAIARQIVVAHDGTIWAESAPGAGTTINIFLAPHPALM